MQLLVEAARVTDGRALRIGGPPPQRSLVGVTVDAAGVRAKAKVFLLNKLRVLRKMTGDDKITKNSPF